MRIINQAKFNRLYKESLGERVKQFEIKFKKRPERFKREYLNDSFTKIDSDLSSFQTKCPEQTRIFLGSFEIRKSEGVEFSSAIEKYCCELDKQAIPLIDILADLLAMYLFRNYITDAMSYFDKGLSKKIVCKNLKSAYTEHFQSPKQNVDSGLSLFELFKEESMYKLIMSALVKNGYCDKDNYSWINKERGYKQKICGLLLQLYYNEFFYTPIMPEKNVFIAVALNTFKIAISISTFKLAAKNDSRKEFEFLKAKTV